MLVNILMILSNCNKLYVILYLPKVHQTTTKLLNLNRSISLVKDDQCLSSSKHEMEAFICLECFENDTTKTLIYLLLITTGIYQLKIHVTVMITTGFYWCGYSSYVKLKSQSFNKSYFSILIFLIYLNLLHNELIVHISDVITI